MNGVTNDKKRQLIVSIIITVAAAIYLISPIDIIPDALFGFGQMDDLAVVALAITNLVKSVKLWREAKARNADAETGDSDGEPVKTDAEAESRVVDESEEQL